MAIESDCGGRMEWFRPSRGDIVEAWLRNKRDVYPVSSPEWYAIDHALDEYRLHSDTGTPLNERIRERE